MTTENIFGNWNNKSDPSLYRVHEKLNNKNEIIGYIPVNALKKSTISKITDNDQRIGKCIEVFQGLGPDTPHGDTIYQPLIDKKLLTDLFGDNKLEMWKHVKNVADLSAKALWLQHHKRS